MLASLMIIALTTALQTAPVPPPPFRMAADCARPIYASEHLICETPELLHQEVAIAELWRQAEPRLQPGPWLEDQEAWFRRRALCAFQTRHRECVAAANQERTVLLTSVDTSSVISPALTCTADDGLSFMAMKTPDGTALVGRQDGKGHDGRRP